MKLVELFDKPQSYTWTQKTPQKWEGVFPVEDSYYQVRIKNLMGTAVIEFARRENDDREPKSRITGTGNSQLVFTTVLSMVKEFLSKNEVKRFAFSAADKAESRMSLYSRLVNRFAKSYGFERVYNTPDGETYPQDMFVLDKVTKE